MNVRQSNDPTAIATIVIVVAPLILTSSGYKYPHEQTAYAISIAMSKARLHLEESFS